MHIALYRNAFVTFSQNGKSHSHRDSIPDRPLVCNHRVCVCVCIYIYIYIYITDLRAVRDRMPVGVRFPAPVQTGPGSTQHPVQWVMGLFCGGKAAETWR